MSYEDEKISVGIQALIDGGPLVEAVQSFIHGGHLAEDGVIGEENYSRNYHCLGFDPANKPELAWPIVANYRLLNEPPTEGEFFKRCASDEKYCRLVLTLILMCARLF